MEYKHTLRVPCTLYSTVHMTFRSINTQYSTLTLYNSDSYILTPLTLSIYSSKSCALFKRALQSFSSGGDPIRRPDGSGSGHLFVLVLLEFESSMALGLMSIAPISAVAYQSVA